MLKLLICHVFFRDTVGLAGLLALQVPLKDRCSRGQGGWCPSASSSWWTVPGHMARMAAAELGWRTPMIMWSIKGWRALTYTPIIQRWVLLYIWVSFEMFSCDSANLNVCFLDLVSSGCSALFLRQKFSCRQDQRLQIHPSRRWTGTGWRRGNHRSNHCRHRCWSSKLPLLQLR